MKADPASRFGAAFASGLRKLQYNIIELRIYPMFEARDLPTARQDGIRPGTA